MLWKTKKDKIMLECMQNVKMATLYRCERILMEDKPYVKIIWNEHGKKEPVYVNSDTVISLINGKTYSILKSSIMEKIEDIHKVRIGEYQVFSLEPLSSFYTEEQSILLYKNAKAIHEAQQKNVKNKEKAYS